MSLADYKKRRQLSVTDRKDSVVSPLDDLLCSDQIIPRSSHPDQAPTRPASFLASSDQATRSSSFLGPDKPPPTRSLHSDPAKPPPHSDQVKPISLPVLPGLENYSGRSLTHLEKMEKEHKENKMKGGMNIIQ